MNRFRAMFATTTIVATLFVGLALNASAQTYPNKPVRLVIPFAPGGTTDIVGRFISDRLGRELGQPVIIENRAGGGGTVGADYVAKAAPDGYVLSMATVSTMATNPAMNPKMPYDATRDFVPVINLVNVPTFAEVGLKEANNMAWYGLLAPAGTPRDVVEKIRAAAIRTLADPDTRKRLIESGAIIDGGSSEAFAQKIAREQALRRDIVKKQKLTLE